MEEQKNDVFFEDEEPLKEITVEDRQKQIRDIQTKASSVSILQKIDDKTRGMMENLDALAGLVYAAAIFMSGYLMHSGKLEAWVILGFGVATGLFKQKIAVGPIMQILQRGREQNKSLLDAVKNTIRIK